MSVSAAKSSGGADVKRLVMYAVMVNDEMVPRSLCGSREGAESYLGDAQHAAGPGAKVYVAKVTIEPVRK